MDDDAKDWAALAREVKARRDQQEMSQAEVADRGGPSEATIRRIERQEMKGELRANTKAQLELVLGWRTGNVDRILDGTVTAEDLSALSMRSGTAGRDGARIGASVSARGMPLVRLRFLGDESVTLERPPPERTDVVVTHGDIVEVFGTVADEQDAAYVLNHLDGPRVWLRTKWELVGAHVRHQAQATFAGQGSMMVSTTSKTHDEEATGVTPVSGASLGALTASAGAHAEATVSVGGSWTPVPIGQVRQTVGQAIAALAGAEQTPAVVEALQHVQKAFLALTTNGETPN